MKFSKGDKRFGGKEQPPVVIGGKVSSSKYVCKKKGSAILDLDIPFATIGGGMSFANKIRICNAMREELDKL